MFIGELSNLTGLSVHTIRYYEKIGLIDKKLVMRMENNYKNYNEVLVNRIKIIKFARNAGFRLSEILDLMNDTGLNSMTTQMKINILEDKLLELNSKISEINSIREIVSQKIRRLKGELK